MRHVLVLNQFALPRSEGGGTRHVDLFGRLQDWNVVIMAGDRNHYSQQRFQTDDARFRLIRIPSQYGAPGARLVGWLLFAAQALARGVAGRRPDVVVGSSPQPIAALAGLVLARTRRVPFVLEVRDLWPESAVSAGRLRPGGVVYRVFRGIERLVSTSADRIICVTGGWTDHFEQLGVPAERLVVIPNGSEPDDFDVARSRADLRRAYDIHGFTAVFAGAHGAKDGIDLVLDAARELPGVRFLLVGSGPIKAGAIERAGRERLVNVDFREPVPKTELPSLLRACDVGIHAVSPLPVFRQGMSPNKLFDYMAAELPVVSNAGAAVSSVASDQECGRIGESDDLRSCLADVLAASDAQRAEWGRRSGEILRERYSRRAAARLLEHTLDDVVAQRSGREGTR